MSSSKESLIETLKLLKQRVLEVEKKSKSLSETDTRQGLINVLFKALGWDFSDFESVRSEFRNKNYNDPVDYAFFHSKDNNKPVLLVEAKFLGTDLNNGKVIKQLCTYLGEMGVQWGVLTDGNKYIMYNSKSGVSFEEQKFLTIQIKNADTEDGLPFSELADKLIALLSRSYLENDEIQTSYESYVLNRHIGDALTSLLTEPFDTLAQAVKKEFKEERVKVDPNLKITQKQILSYLESIKDEDGKIPMDIECETGQSDSFVLSNIANFSENQIENLSTIKDISNLHRSKRVTILDLLESQIVHVGDNWRFEYKGEVTWARVTRNGELEINGKTYTSPSSAGTSIIDRGTCNGWLFWSFKDSSHSNKWRAIKVLRDLYIEKYNLVSLKRSKKAA